MKNEQTNLSEKQRITDEKARKKQRKGYRRVKNNLIPIQHIVKTLKNRVKYL